MDDPRSSGASEEARARLLAEARAAAAISAREALERELLEAVRGRAEIEAQVRIAVEARQRAERYAADQARRIGEADAEIRRLRALVEELLSLPLGHPWTADPAQSDPAQADPPACDPPPLPHEAPDDDLEALFGPLAVHQDEAPPGHARQEIAPPGEAPMRRERPRLRERHGLRLEAKRPRALASRATGEEAQPVRGGGAAGRAAFAASAAGIAALMLVGAWFLVPWGTASAGAAESRLDQAGGVLNARSFDYSMLDLGRLEQAMGADRPGGIDALGEWAARAPEAARRELETVDPAALGEVLARTSLVVRLDEVTAFSGRFDDGRLSEAFGDPGEGPWLGAQGALPFALQRCGDGLCLWHGDSAQPAQLVDPAALLSEDGSVRALMDRLEAARPFLLRLHRAETMGAGLARWTGGESLGIVTAGCALAGTDGSTLLLGFDFENEESARAGAGRIEEAVRELIAQSGLAEESVEIEVRGALVVVEATLPERGSEGGGRAVAIDALMALAA